MCSVAVRSQQSPRAVALALTSLLLLAGACGGHYVSRGTELFDDGRYVEAAEVFERTEERLAASSNAERARFGLYRGATFLKLGDVPHAARWLGYARSIKNSDPSALGRDDSQLLDNSLKAIGSVDSSVPARKERSELATAPGADAAATQ